MPNRFPDPPGHAPNRESLADFLERRERELTAELAAIRGQIPPRQAELGQIRKIRSLLATAREFGLKDEAGGSLLTTPSEQILRSVFTQIDCRLPAGRYEKMTIKELAMQALIDNFPEGATLAQIRDFIRDAYGRTIEPSSLRPQMHRLKVDQILGQDPSTGTWNFRDGKRSLHAMYDHPTSRAAMKELQDETPQRVARIE